MDRIPLNTIAGLIELVDDDLKSGRDITPNRAKLYLKSYRSTLLALKEALEERDRLKRYEGHEYQ
jgi:hypothetical protein